MTKLVWDNISQRLFETGLDRGVLYPPGKSGVAWNGLVSATPQADNSKVTPLYYDGRKTFDLVNPGTFSAKVTAITYPDEFLEFDGYTEFASGMFFDNQPKKTFGLCYRTLLGNDVDGSDYGYKVHLLYNLTAIADNPTYQTVSSNVEPIDFSWTCSSTPVLVPSHRPTGHVILDSTRLDSGILATLEDILYGTVSTAPRLPSIPELLTYLVLEIIDNGDGTWTAIGPSGMVGMIDSKTFQITAPSATMLDSNTYRISSV